MGTRNKASKYRVDGASSIEDVDLDEVEVRLPDGRRLTEELAAELAADTIARAVGRPSLSGRAERSPHLGVRVTAELNERVRRRAAAEGKRASDIVREALEHYV